MGLIKTDAYTAEQLGLASALRALAHPARVAILQKLVSESCCICRAFTDEIALAQPTISRHLGELETAGLIQGSAFGTTKRYCIAPERWREVSGLLRVFFDSVDEATAAC